MNDLFMVLMVALAFVVIIALVAIVLTIHPAWGKVDVNTGTFATTHDINGFHIRGWVTNITNNETDTDFSIEMTFQSGHFMKFVLGFPTDANKAVLPPGQTMFWDLTTKETFAGEHYNHMLVRYNEIPFPR